MRFPRFLKQLRWRFPPGRLAEPGTAAAEGQAMADAEDMIARLGVQWAYLVAHEHAQAERGGVGAGLFPPGHWARVRTMIRRMMRVR